VSQGDSPFERALRAILIALATVCVAGGANAQHQPRGDTGTYALSFVRGAGAEGCPGRQDLEREVSAKLGYSPFDGGAPKSIEILTELRPDGYRSVVSAVDGDGKLLGRRVLSSDEPSCAPIFSATALAVALLIDPEAALRNSAPTNEAVGRFEIDEPVKPPPRPPPSPLAPSVPPVYPLPTKVVVREPLPREKANVFTGADAGVAFGLVPAASPVVGIFVDGRPDPFWGFSLSALYVSKQSVSDDAGATLDVSLTTFGLALTVSAVDRPKFRLAPDLGFIAGALHVAVREGQALHSSDQGFYALGAGVRAELVVIRGLFLTTRVGAVIPFIRRGLSVEGALEPIWLEPGFAGIASFGVGWAFF
jgi:hypothetical protein